MSKGFNFYRSGSDKRFFNDDVWKDERQLFKQLGCKILTADEANQLKPLRLFDNLCSMHFEKDYAIYEALPREDLPQKHIPFPYQADEHEDLDIENSNLEKILETHVNEYFSNTKYLVTNNPEFCIALEFQKFSYELIYPLMVIKTSSGLVLFDSEMSRNIKFDLYAGINVYSRDEKDSHDQVYGKTDSYWLDYFQDNFVQGARHGRKAGAADINKKYVPRIHGMEPFDLSNIKK